MNKILSGTIAGLIFGIIDVLLMVPLPIENKLIAMLASFIGRFAIGFFVATTDIPVPFWLKGILVGLLLSLPDAIITKAYAPIIGIGVIGGLIIGLVLGRLQV